MTSKLMNNEEKISMASSGNRINVCRSEHGKKSLRLVPCAVLAMGLLFAGCYERTPISWPWPQPQTFDMKPRNIIITSDDSMHITFEPVKDIIFLRENHPACADFKFFVDGKEASTVIEFFAVTSSILVVFERDTFEVGKMYDIKVEYAADPARPIETVVYGTRKRGVLSSFTIQKTAMCSHRGSD